MKIHFKMLINDGEKYYISDNPGIALCDYVYMRGLESIDDNRFWEEQLAHYQAHKAFNFDLDLVASSSIANISNAIAERIGFDKRKDCFQISLTLCSDNMTDEQRNACVEISKALGLPDKKSNWRWKRINSWKRHLISPDLGDDEYRLKIEKALDTDWSDIQEFEAGLML